MQDLQPVHAARSILISLAHCLAVLSIMRRNLFRRRRQCAEPSFPILNEERRLMAGSETACQIPHSAGKKSLNVLTSAML